jgi:galactose oxidase
MKLFRTPPLLQSLCLILSTSAVAQAAYSITVDSAETTNPGSYAIDGNTSTFWHTDYSITPVPVFPHTAVIDLASELGVSGISYTPRQDGAANGNIGQHELFVSTDNENWTQVSAGSFLDDQTVKVINITPVSARYVKLVALSEAGNRGNWTSAAEITVSIATSVTAQDASVLGDWYLTLNFPLVPAAAALLPSGKLLTWSSYMPKAYGGTGKTVTATYDPSAGTISGRTVSNTEHDMFCPGLSTDFNGQVIVTGGDDAYNVSFYAPGTDAWTGGPEMKISRGYQGQTTLSDGRTFVIGGSWSGGHGGKNGEIYNPTTNSWSLLSGCPVAPMLTADAGGVFRQDNHGWLFAWKSGSVFQAGPSKAMNW